MTNTNEHRDEIVKWPERYVSHQYDASKHEHFEIPYVREDLYTALQSANAELVKQVEELNRTAGHALMQLGDAQLEIGRHRQALEEIMKLDPSGCDLDYRIASEALSPTTVQPGGEG